MKKAQSGVESAMEAATAKRNKKGPALREGQKNRLDRIAGSNPDRAIKVGKRMLKRAAPMMKNGGTKKAENGKKTAFGMLSVKAGVDKNPNPTAADRIAGAKKKMKNGGGMLSAPKKDGLSMELGSYDRQIGKNYTGKATKAVGLTKAKYGKSIMKMGGKCKNGC